MERIIFIIFLAMMIYETASISYKSPSLNYTYILGSNLVNNSNFSSPVISPNYYADYSLEMNGWKTKGTYVEYTLPCLMTKFYFCPVYKGVTCGWQFIDVDSQYNNQLYYQRYIFTDVQEYQLRFDWISEISYLLSSTGLSVYWNGVAIDSFYDSNCTLYTSTYYVKGKIGLNQVAFEGIGLMDSMGIMIRNIQIKQLIYSYPASNSTNNSSANATANSTTTNNSIISNSSSSINSSSNSVNSTSNSNSSTISINATNASNSSNSTGNSSLINGSNDSNSSNTSNLGNNTANYTNQSLANSSIAANETNSSSATSNQTNSTQQTTTSNSTDNATNQTSNVTNSTTEAVASVNNTGSNNTSNNPDNTTANNASQTTNSSTTNDTSGQANTTNNSSNIEPNNTYQLPDYGGYNYRSYQSLAQFYNSSQYSNLLKIYDFATKHKSVLFCRSLFSSQQNLRFIVGFMMEFNHLIIYNYHIRNLTLMSNFILVSIQALDQQKAYLTDEYIYPLIGTSAEMILSDFKNRIDLPTNPNNIGSELIKRPNGVLLEITDMIFVDVPVTLVSFIIGYFLFRLLFNFRISILFRQYALAGMFFFVLLNGKIEVLTFHFLSEILQFTSIGLQQKIFMAAIVFFYFFVFIFSISLMMIYKSAYKKLVKFIYENCRQPQYSVPFMTISFGFYNLALGFAHRLLLNHPNWQIYVLILIEIAYLIALIVLIINKFFENILLGVSLCIMNLLRLAFIFTCLIYTYSYDIQEELNQIQQYLFYGLVISWLVSIVLGLLQKFIIIFKIIKHSVSRSTSNINRIQPDNTGIPKRGRVEKTMGHLKARRINFKQNEQEKTRSINQLSITIKSLKGASKSKKTIFTRVDGFTRTNILQSTAAIKQKTTVLIKNNHYSLKRNIAS